MFDKYSLLYENMKQDQHINTSLTGKTIEPHKKKEEMLGKSIAGKEWNEKKENKLS